MARYVFTSRKELADLFKAWIAIGLAFAIVMNGIRFDSTFLIAFVISLITVGTGFVVHEMCHKLVAQKFRCWAEFRSDDKMLLLAVVFSLLGFVFAAPGAVMIRGHIDKRQNGLISAAGPASNLAVALAFFAMFFSSNPFLAIIGSYGFRINTWLAAFNLIPIGIFDGSKIFRWSKLAYLSLVAVAVAMMVLQFNI